MPDLPRDRIVHIIVTAAGVDNAIAADVAEAIMATIVRPLDTYARMWCREAFRLAERDGWVAFGTHLDEPRPALEFDGDDCGIPMWERPIRP